MYFNGSVYGGGGVDHPGANLHPLNLAEGEGDAFEKNSGTIFEMSPAVSIDTGAAKPVVSTTQGKVICKTLILCGNAYLGNVVPQLTWRGRPFSTQGMATGPPGEGGAKSPMPRSRCGGGAR